MALNKGRYQKFFSFQIEGFCIDLLRAVHKSLAMLAKNGFDAVFQRWVHRGGKCAEINGNYVAKVVSFSGQLI